MTTILFYITGHGFGHATRIVEVINQLLIADPGVLPVVCTTVPEWLFGQQVAGRFRYVRCAGDVGAVQADWRSVDKLETLRRYSSLMEQEPAFTREQTAFCRRNNVAAIVSDIPAVAFVIARKVGVPGFGITNFSWDWIYAPYLEEFPQYEFVVRHIRECYSQADCLLRLPFFGDLSAFPVIEDIPLIARKSTRDRNEVLEHLDLDPDRKIVLLYLGSFDPDLVLSEEMQANGEYVFVRGGAVELGSMSFQDLVKAADALVTKPGYGIVSDCIANRTPILYTSREDFLEYDALVSGIREYASARFVPREDLLAKRWTDHLEELLAQDWSWPQIATNGAETAAHRILQALC